MIRETKLPVIPVPPQACAGVDLDAIRDNAAALQSRARTCELMGAGKGRRPFPPTGTGGARRLG